MNRGLPYSSSRREWQVLVGCFGRLIATRQRGDAVEIRLSREGQRMLKAWRGERDEG